MKGFGSKISLHFYCYSTYLHILLTFSLIECLLLKVSVSRQLMNNQCQRISEENSVDTNFECITEVGDLKADRSLDEDDASQYVIISGSVDSCRTDDWSVFSLSSAGFKEEPSDFNSRTIPSASRDIDSNETGADIRRHASAENFEKVRNLDTINALSRKHHSYGSFSNLAKLR